MEILKELGREYGSQLMTIYASGYDRDGGDDRRALEAGLTYLAERKQELKVLFSEHVENFLAGVAMEIINERASENARTTDLDDRRDEYLLCAATSASAAFGFIQTWMTMGIERTPAELAGILKVNCAGQCVRGMSLQAVCYEVRPLRPNGTGVGAKTCRDSLPTR